MKKRPFYQIYLITLCGFATPTYAVVRYLELTRDVASISVGNTLLTSIVVSILPSVLISIWWWNHQDKEE